MSSLATASEITVAYRTLQSISTSFNTTTTATTTKATITTTATVTNATAFDASADADAAAAAAAEHAALVMSINTAIVVIDVIGLILNLPAVIWLIKHRNRTPMFFVLRAAGVSNVVLLAGQLICSLSSMILHNCECHYQSQVLDVIGVGYLLDLVHMSNLWLTVLMSIERYTAICRPYLHPKLCSRNTLIGITVGIVVFSAFYCSFNLALLCNGDTELADSEEITSCTFVDDPSGFLFMMFTWYESAHAAMAIADHVLAMALLTTSYACILNELRLASKRWYELTLVKRTECSSSRMPTCIITIFFLFESPKVVMDIICLTGLMEIDHTTVYKETTTLLLQLCSATNVVVYFIFSESIRRRLLHMCCVSESRIHQMKVFHRMRLGSQISRANASLSTTHQHDCEQVGLPCLALPDSDAC